jgi:hypothetical protein
MTLMRRTRVFRTVGWLVCQLIELPSVDDVDQAALDAHIAAVAEYDRDTAGGPSPAEERSAARLNL